MYFILDDKRNVLPASYLEWSQFMDQGRDQLVKTYMDGVEVSTIFTGLNGFGPPRYFQTAVYVREEMIEEWKCATWEEALSQHAELVGAYKKIQV